VSIFYKKLSHIKDKKILLKTAIYENDSKKINYFELKKLINFYSTSLNKIGKKLCVAIIADISIEVIAALFAISKLNFSVVIIDKDVSKKQLKKYYLKVKFDLIITHEKYKHQIEIYKSKIISFEKIHYFKKKISPNKKNNKFFISSFSSGTTNNPKPIYYTENCKFLRSIQSQKIFKVKEKDRMICYSPIHHSLAQRIVFLSLTNYCTLYIMKKFNYFTYAELIKRNKINVLFPISSHLNILFEKLKNKNFNFIRLIIASSADLSLNMKKKVFKFFKNKFIEIYGLSEAAILSTLNYKHYKQKKTESVGKLCAGIKVKIFDNKLTLKNNQIGEIGCDSNLLSNFDKNYQGNFVKNFYLTGDLGYLKNDYLYFTGRKKEIIIKSGVNIYPKDIQAEIIRNKFINNCLVIGLKDEFYGEVPIAVCELKQLNKKNLNTESLKVKINKNLPKMHKPHKYIFTKKIKLLKTGKIDKLYYKNKYQNLKIPNLSHLFSN